MVIQLGSRRVLGIAYGDMLEVEVGLSETSWTTVSIWSRFRRGQARLLSAVPAVLSPTADSHSHRSAFRPIVPIEKRGLAGKVNGDGGNRARIRSRTCAEPAGGATNRCAG
jgi:hypothetical protein